MKAKKKAENLTSSDKHDSTKSELPLSTKQITKSIKRKKKKDDANLITKVEGEVAAVAGNKKHKTSETILRILELFRGRTESKISNKVLITKNINSPEKQASILDKTKRKIKNNAIPPKVITPENEILVDHKTKSFKEFVFSKFYSPRLQTISKKQIRSEVIPKQQLSLKSTLTSADSKFRKNINSKSEGSLDPQKVKEKSDHINLLKTKETPIEKDRDKNRIRFPQILHKSKKISEPDLQLIELIKPLKDKTPQQKEVILKSLALQGLPFPEPKSQFEKKLIEKVRTDVGLPLEPKTRALKETYAKAAAAGFMQPLEQKTRAQKVKILRGLHDLGIPPPIGRTPSEKILIAIIYSGTPVPEKKQNVLANGILSLFRRQKIEKEDNIINVAHVAPIPDDITITEIPKPKTSKLTKILRKRPTIVHKSNTSNKDLLTPSLLRRELGVSLLPKNQTSKTIKELTDWKVLQNQPITISQESLDKMFERKILTTTPTPTSTIRSNVDLSDIVTSLVPLGELSQRDQEKALRAQTELGVPLEGKTLYEKLLIAKVKAEAKVACNDLTERVRKLKVAGLLPPCKEISSDEKEILIKEILRQGLPLLQAKTISEKELITRVKEDMGLGPKHGTSGYRTSRNEHAIVARALLLSKRTVPTKKSITPPKQLNPVTLYKLSTYKVPAKENFNKQQTVRSLKINTTEAKSEEKSTLCNNTTPTNITSTNTLLFNRMDESKTNDFLVHSIIRGPLQNVEKQFGTDDTSDIKKTLSNQKLGCNKKKIRFRQSLTSLTLSSDLHSFNHFKPHPDKKIARDCKVTSECCVNNHWHINNLLGNNKKVVDDIKPVDFRNLPTKTVFNVIINKFRNIHNLPTARNTKKNSSRTNCNTVILGI